MSLLRRLLDFSDVKAHPLDRMRERVLAFLVVPGILGEAVLFVMDLRSGQNATNNLLVLVWLVGSLVLLRGGRGILAAHAYLLPFTLDFFRTFVTGGGVATHGLPLLFLLIVVSILLLPTSQAVGYVAILLLGVNGIPVEEQSPVTGEASVESLRRKRLIIVNIIAVSMTTVFTVVWYWLKRYLAELLNHVERLDDLVRVRTRELDVEKERSESLLKNIPPESVAEQLKREESRPVERFSDASVAFIDLVGFTAFARGRSPADLVQFLDATFEVLDRLAEEHGVEKIKTIGDAYLVASGIPEADPQHLRKIADFALAAREALASEALRVRIGISAGPVVAGVIGRRKFHYDLWGDTVNVASRMESTGEVGRIQIPCEVARQLEAHYAIEARGAIDVTGIGSLETCFLEGVARA